MTSKKKITGASVTAVVVAVIGLIGASSGTFNFDFSQTNIDSHDRTNIITNIINQMGLDITPEELDTMCSNSEQLEEPFKTACNVIIRNTGGN